jgi:hypothetical protein
MRGGGGGGGGQWPLLVRLSHDGDVALQPLGRTPPDRGAAAGGFCAPLALHATRNPCLECTALDAAAQPLFAPHQQPRFASTGDAVRALGPLTRNGTQTGTDGGAGAVGGGGGDGWWWWWPWL